MRVGVEKTERTKIPTVLFALPRQGFVIKKPRHYETSTDDLLWDEWPEEVLLVRMDLLVRILASQLQYCHP